MLRSNVRNNFAPFAGYMLQGFEKRVSLARSDAELAEMSDDAQATVERAAQEPDDERRAQQLEHHEPPGR